MKVRQSTFILSIIFFLTGVSGCMSIKKYEGAVKQEIIAYLEKKYDEKFVLEYFVPAGNGFNRPPYDEAVVYVENDELLKFAVQRRENKESKTYSFTDGYAFRIAERKFLREIDNIANVFFEDYKLTTDITTTTPEFTKYSYDKNLELSELLNKETRVMLSARVYINSRDIIDKNKEAKKIYSFMNKIQENKCWGIITFLYFEPDEFNKIEYEKLNLMKLDYVEKQFNVKNSTFSEVNKDMSIKDSEKDVIYKFEN